MENIHPCVIVKFLRREDKIALMRSKRKLKDTVHYQGIYIEEDLTLMRRRIVNILKETGGRQRRVWTIDGKVHAKEPTEQGGERRITINHSKDL